MNKSSYVRNFLSFSLENVISFPTTQLEEQFNLSKNSIRLLKSLVDDNKSLAQFNNQELSYIIKAIDRINDQIAKIINDNYDLLNKIQKSSKDLILIQELEKERIRSYKKDYQIVFDVNFKKDTELKMQLGVTDLFRIPNNIKSKLINKDIVLLKDLFMYSQASIIKNRILTKEEVEVVVKVLRVNYSLFWL